MSFATALALAVGLFVAAPIAAHLLRRRRAGEVVLPTARLLSTTPPAARRRSALEDRGLFVVRLLAVVLLALLGATPFVSCSKLALLRKDGASVAMVLVVDDSLSMSATSGDETRFERAKRAARELVSAVEPGDSVAIVLAGREVRVHLSPTTDREAIDKAIAALEPSHRPTDLEDALRIGRDLLRRSPQADKRLVLLSDLADGHADAPPLDVDSDVSLWTPIPELAARSEADCAIRSAERLGDRVDVAFVCTEGATAAGRAVSIFDKKTEIAKEQVPDGADSVALKVPEGAGNALDAVLSPGDAVAADDAAPVVEHARDLSLAIVADAAAAHVETGGPPPVERALAALGLGAMTKPVATIPEHAEELAAFAGMILDDPPGLTPEERRSAAEWVEGGGTIVLSLGRRAASAPLGAGFGDLLPGVVRWSSEAPAGATPASCAFFGASAESLAELAPKGRVSIDHEAVQGAEVLCAWSDGAPLLLRRRIGRGSVLVSSLPFDLDTSDLPLRPAFLVLLDRFVEHARARGGSRVVEAGEAFVVHGFDKVEASLQPVGSERAETLPAVQKDGTFRVAAPRIGRYSLSLDGSSDVRFAVVPEGEVDLRPRGVAQRAADPSLGGQTRELDASPYVAFALLALLVLELAVRAFSQGSRA
ncbi:MAG: BatA and WFA domain-containing protein [Myxococcales bacterium]|nr:BatA and WFA domain-containing protein [Myxococcales bacterium]